VFSGGQVDFSEARFGGARLDLRRSRVAGGKLFFCRAHLEAGEVDLTDAKLEDGLVDFRDVHHIATRFEFGGAALTGTKIVLDAPTAPDWLPVPSGP
jgi:hypothetical protein